MIHKSLQRKLKIDQHEPHRSRRSCLLHWWLHRATLIIHPVIIHEQFILTVYGSYKWRWPPTRLFIIIAVFILFVINYVKVFNIISSEFTQDKYSGDS